MTKILNLNIVGPVKRNITFAFAVICFVLISKPVFADAGACAQSLELEKAPSLAVAAVQYPMAEAITEDAFFAKVEHYISQAHSNGSELVVFPELITTELVNWWVPDEGVSQLEKIAKEFTPKYKKWLEEKAVQYNIAILGGTTPRKVKNGIVNTAILAQPNGKTLLQDKIFMTPDEKGWNWNPGQKLNVFNTKWGKTVILTCFDCEFPMVSNMLAKDRPDLILIPSWTSTASGLNRVDWSARARAIEHYAYVVKTGTVAAVGARLPHHGQASIVGPQDYGFPTETVEGQKNAEGVIYGNLDLALQRRKKAKSGFYPGNEQNIRTANLKTSN